MLMLKLQKELWLLPETEHCGAYFSDRSAYVNKLTAFFDLSLKKTRLPIQLKDRIGDEQAGGDRTGGPPLSEAS